MRGSNQVKSTAKPQHWQKDLVESSIRGTSHFKVFQRVVCLLLRRMTPAPLFHSSGSIPLSSPHLHINQVNKEAFITPEPTQLVLAQHFSNIPTCLKCESPLRIAENGMLGGWMVFPTGYAFQFLEQAVQPRKLCEDNPSLKGRA